MICPAGYFCPAGTGLDWKACPRGTYSDVEGLYTEEQCKTCPGGQYCDGEHLNTPSGELVFYSDRNDHRVEMLYSPLQEIIYVSLISEQLQKLNS